MRIQPWVRYLPLEMWQTSKGSDALAMRAPYARARHDFIARVATDEHADEAPSLAPSVKVVAAMLQQ